MNINSYDGITLALVMYQLLIFKRLLFQSIVVNCTRTDLK